MAPTPPPAAPLPTARSNPFDPPRELARLRRDRPLARMAYPDGHVGWLVTSHALARTVLADQRFSARNDLRHVPAPGYRAAGPPPPAPPGAFVDADPPEHTRYRRLLTGQFTVRRMRQLGTRIREITDAHLDAVQRHGTPVDLVPAFALPIPSLVICELLGVPYADRDRFQHQSAVLTRVDVPREDITGTYAAVADYLAGLVRAKRAEPTDDVLGGLVATADLTDEEITNIGFMLLGAGLETTANMLALGTFALLRHPGQLAAFRAADPGDVERAVEELLRYLSIVPWTVRAALEDVELAGHLIRAGESVTVSLAAANRDPQRFPDPDTLDLTRSVAGHVAFGHGVHQCLGQQLARIEMQVAYPALFQRFPGLRLAVPPEEVPTKQNTIFHGLQRLPVAW